MGIFFQDTALINYKRQPNGEITRPQGRVYTLGDDMTKKHTEVAMISSLYKVFIFGLAIILSVFMVFPAIAPAADDPSIKGSLRENIKTSMMSHIEGNMVDNTYILYDAVEGRLMKLKLDRLHDGIVKKGDFYVSCADFFDRSGKKIDVDFLVLKDGAQLKTIQAVVHSVEGKKRKYHLES